MRTKKAILNYLSEVIPQIIILILGFFKTKVFLNEIIEKSWLKLTFARFLSLTRFLRIIIAEGSGGEKNGLFC